MIQYGNMKWHFCNHRLQNRRHIKEGWLDGYFATYAVRLTARRIKIGPIVRRAAVGPLLGGIRLLHQLIFIILL